MKIVGKILKIVGILIGTVVGLAVLGLLFLTIVEYRPKQTENLEVRGNATKTLKVGEDVNVLTWNIGYGSLGDYADFFMDGGTMVDTSTEDQVVENTKAVAQELKSLDADIVLLQEVDEKSKRSHAVDEKATLEQAMDDYMTSFAYNFKAIYVPYPWPPMGQVNSGIMTFTKYEVTDATREKLPCPFGWPLRIANLKRCLLVSRIPVEGTDKELVLINLHLEAYDDGEGKIEQTKQLKNLIESEVEAGNYVIAGGDFNQVFSNVDTSAYPVISEDLWQPGEIDVNEFSGATFYTDNLAPTCRSLDRVYEGANDSEFQFYMIDGFIVSNNVNVNSVTTCDLKFENSDHNPVLLNLQLQ